MKKIQIIEDSAEIRENTSELLELNGYEITASANGTSSLEIFRENQPDLVICDLHRPESGGQNFIEHLKTDFAFSKIPIIFFTGEDGLPEWFTGNNVIKNFGYLQKPFTGEELLEAVSMCLHVDGNHKRE